MNTYNFKTTAVGSIPGNGTPTGTRTCTASADMGPPPVPNLIGAGQPPLIAQPRQPEASGAGLSGPPPPASTHDGYFGVTNLQTFQPTVKSPPGTWPAMAYNGHQHYSTNNLSNTHNYKASSSPEPGESNGAQGKPHRRGYQACDGCRARKVKCDLGSKSHKPDPLILSPMTWSYRRR